MKKQLLSFMSSAEKSSFDAQQLAAIAFEIEDGAILFNFEDAFEDDRSSIFDAGMN